MNDLLNIRAAQRRAKAGGERGVNGEWYEGGEWIANTDEPKKHKQRTVSTGRQEYEPYKWDVAPEGKLSIYRTLAGTEKFDRATGKFSFNESLSSYYATPEAIENRKKRIEMYNAGERWFDAPNVKSSELTLPDAAGPLLAGRRQGQPDSGGLRPPLETSPAIILRAVRAERLARRAAKVLAAQAVQARESDAPDLGLVAKVLVFDAGGRVLLLHDARADRWDLPGGHLRQGERPEAGAERETFEETGLRVRPQNGSTRGVDYGGAVNKTIILYETHVSGHRPRVTLSPEHDRYEWVKAGDAKLYPMGAFAGLVPGVAVGHGAARDEAQKRLSAAVGKVLGRAHSDATGEDAGERAYRKFAVGALAAALGAAFGAAASRLAGLARGEDRRDAATKAEERAHAERRTELLGAFVDDTRAKVQAEKRMAEELGESEAELFERVDAAMKELEERADKIAEEEAHAVYGAAQAWALVRAGYETMYWVAVGDERTCEVCEANEAAGQVHVGAQFPSGHEAPPAHPNCRCWLEGGKRA